MLRRFVTLAVSCCFVLSMAVVPVELLLAQDAKQAVPPPTKAQAVTKETPTPAQTKPGDQAKTAEPTKDDGAKKDAGKTEPAKPAEPPLKPIPPEVQAKIDAARKAVAEAIVAAQDAGLIETSIDPPPILDLLIDGRVTDARTLKAPKQAGLPYGVSPEVFGAWFTGYGKMEGIDYEHDVRIVPPSGGTDPSKGLKQWYDQRAQDPGAIHCRDPQDPSGTGQKGRDEARTGQSRPSRPNRLLPPRLLPPRLLPPRLLPPRLLPPRMPPLRNRQNPPRSRDRHKPRFGEERTVLARSWPPAPSRPGGGTNKRVHSMRPAALRGANKVQPGSTSARSRLKDARPFIKNGPCIFRFPSHPGGLSEDQPAASRLGRGRRTLVPRFAPIVA